MNKKIKKNLVWTALAAIVYTIFATFFNIIQVEKYYKSVKANPDRSEDRKMKRIPNPIVSVITLIVFVFGGGSLGDG